MSEKTFIDRRKFIGQLASGSGATTLLLASSSDSMADEKEETTADSKPPVKTEPPALPSEELLLLRYLTQKYPSEHYDDAALQGIYRDIRGDLARSRILSEFPLKNSDGPSFVFRAYRCQE